MIPGSRGVKIDLAKGRRNVCSVPGHEAKFLMGYPLLSFLKESIQTTQNASKGYTNVELIRHPTCAEARK